jgi:hypothetical protein
MKQCKECKNLLNFENFYKNKGMKDGYLNICKICSSIKRRENYILNKNKINEVNRKWRKENREKYLKSSRNYYKNNKKEFSDKNKVYRIENKDKIKKMRENYKENNREKILESNKRYTKSKLGKETRRKYKEKNKEKLRKERREYDKKRFKIDKEYKLLCAMRSNLYRAVKKEHKNGKTIELIGCSIRELKKHLEKNFTDGMSWENYGKWHIDHVIPCANYDLTQEKQQKECFNWKNLQPLWAIDNFKKGMRML